ncbi:hypothetical protein N9R40_02450 [bacterium]|nr:hypothetical protein [bacterium]
MKQAPVLKDEQVKRLLKTTRITQHEIGSLSFSASMLVSERVR